MTGGKNAIGRWIDKIKNSPQPYPQRTDKTDTFDPGQAQQLFAEVLARLNEQYPYGAIGWAKLHRPELWEACQAALAQVEAGWLRQEHEEIPGRQPKVVYRINPKIFPENAQVVN